MTLTLRVAVALDTGVWQTYDITLYKNHLTVVR